MVHTGYVRTLKRIQLDWFWPGMTSDVRRIIRACDTCQVSKKSCLSTKARGNLLVGRPWQQVAIDLVGPMPTTKSGNKWILVLTDHFTRWQDALAIPDATASEVAQALDKRVLCYFGLPECIHSDRGTQFESELFQELCDLWGVDKTRTTPYHPQSNGIVERGNRTLGDSLRCLLKQHALGQDSWDELLPQIMRAFRATPSSFTKESANFLMLGRQCRLPDMLVYGASITPLETHTEYVTNLQRRLEQVHELLREQQHATIPSNYEGNCMYDVGEEVLVDSRRRKKGVNPKLQPQFAGPFKVVEVYPNHTYRLADYKSIVNESRLKKYHRPVETHPVDPQVAPQSGASRAPTTTTAAKKATGGRPRQARHDRLALVPVPTVLDNNLIKPKASESRSGARRRIITNSRRRGASTQASGTATTVKISKNAVVAKKSTKPVEHPTRRDNQRQRRAPHWYGDPIGH